MRSETKYTYTLRKLVDQINAERDLFLTVFWWPALNTTKKTWTEILQDLSKFEGMHFKTLFDVREIKADICWNFYNKVKNGNYAKHLREVVTMTQRVILSNRLYAFYARLRDSQMLQMYQGHHGKLDGYLQKRKKISNTFSNCLHKFKMMYGVNVNLHVYNFILQYINMYR